MRTFTLVESPLLPLDHRCGYSCPCEVNQQCLPEYEGDPNDAAFSSTLPFVPDPQHTARVGSVKPNADANPLLSFVVIVGGLGAGAFFVVWVFGRLAGMVGEMMS